MEPTNEQLIEKAKSLISPRKTAGGFAVGDVGAALITDKGNIYTGVAIDVGGGMGIGAEESAIAAMITAGETKIKKIVAVSEYGIIPPCGKCREFMRQVQNGNLDTQVILGPDKIVTLKTLLPYPW